MIDPETKKEAPKPGAAELAERVAREAKADPARFGELARKHSDDAQSAKSGGLITSGGKEFLAASEMAEPLRLAAAQTEPGSVSDLIESDGSFHVLKVDERRPAGMAPLAEVQDQIELKLRRDLNNKAIRAWIEHLLEGAHIVDWLGRPIDRSLLLRSLSGGEDEGEENEG
jgi:peptidyl-prolyl cis-trans isomerase D